MRHQENHRSPISSGLADYDELLASVCKARDEATRLQLDLTSYLLDMACLDLSANGAQRPKGPMR